MPLPNEAIFQLVGIGRRPVPINVATDAEEIGSPRQGNRVAMNAAMNNAQECWRLTPELRGPIRNAEPFPLNE